MNIPLSWLKQAANITADNKELLDKLTASGNAVEGVAHLGADISGVVVGKITSLERHPDADKLWVTQTDIGTETVQIITGADNLSVGDFIPVATHGASLANGLKIKRGKMRGLDSNGMLCSIEELGYTRADYPESPEDGIYVFPTEHPLGACVKPILELEEDVADFDILSNRPDTNSIIGMAREAAAVYEKELVLPEIKVTETAEGHVSDLVTVEIADPARCPRYIARVVKNVKIGPSPQWLRRRLSTAGIRPINNIVDITNYVMLEYGQPLHAFDISQVAIKDGKHNIVVRTAHPGETITTLDGEEKRLNETTLLIADPEKAIGIAGIMGGENSKILDDTTTILFESANFDAANIRLSSRALGMRTDASARYEKGQDPNIAITSVNRAMELVELLECGQVVPGIVDNYPTKREEHKIEFTPANISASLGVENLSAETMTIYLNRIGILCGTKTQTNSATITATIPTYRKDMAGEADITEEIARFYGLNNIPSRYTQTLSGSGITGHAAGKTPRRKREDKIKQTMLSLGYYEGLTYSFESPKVYAKLNIEEMPPTVNLKNPLGEDFSVMRTLPFTGLLEGLSLNYKKGNETATLFEIASTYHPPLEEKRWLTFVAYGKDIDFLSFKGDAETLLESLTNRPFVFLGESFPYSHPGRTAGISVKASPNPKDEPVSVGYIAELHPQVAENYEINTRVYIAAFDMDALHSIAEAYKFKYKTPPVYPPMTRDFAFKVKEEISAASLHDAIKEKGGQLLSDIKLFDVYQGAQLGDDYKSMAYALTFRAPDRTLTLPEIGKSLDAILDNLQKKFGAEVRG